MSQPIETTLAVILDEVLSRLNAEGLAEDLCSKTIMPGAELIADYGTESCGGMLWLRLLTVNTTQSFPASDVGINNCAYTLAHVCEIGILRPAVIPESNGVNKLTLPTDMEQYEEAVAQMKDMRIMKDALSAVGGEMDDFIIQQYTPEGPDGGIVGGTWVFVVGEE